jgi:hypothetical protein
MNTNVNISKLVLSVIFGRNGFMKSTPGPLLLLAARLHGQEDRRRVTESGSILRRMVACNFKGYQDIRNARFHYLLLIFTKKNIKACLMSN